MFLNTRKNPLLIFSIFSIQQFQFTILFKTFYKSHSIRSNRITLCYITLLKNLQYKKATFLLSFGLTEETREKNANEDSPLYPT